jgi:hypothetical protein
MSDNTGTLELTSEAASAALVCLTLRPVRDAGVIRAPFRMAMTFSYRNPVVL